MRASESNETGTQRPPKQNSTVVLLLGTIADTTWRMFIPVIGLLMLGVWIDKTYQMLPWATLLLTAAGIAIATLLIKRQLSNVKKSS